VNKKLLAHIRENEKMPFQWSGIWNRYFVFFLPAFFLLMAVLFTLDGYYNSGIFPQGREPFLLVFFWGGGILITWYFLHRIESERKFYMIEIEPNAEQILQAIEQLDWKIVDSGKTFFVAHVDISWTSWGDEVTIVSDKNRLLFNARPMAQPFTFNRERVLKKRFERELRNLIEG
jgi:hypothetical protein